ncbi:outer membrane efflux protein [Leptospirillum ferriphilum]|jgi:outer membrane protein TolC|uniref:Outer membrane efflux protein n=3 Tax=Leptospirillum TaxID=179 RepID=A0A094YIR8_9BACT|nr:outer membrane efflux protein [Leptospirillum ferriphilum]
MKDPGYNDHPFRRRRQGMKVFPFILVLLVNSLFFMILSSGTATPDPLSTLAVSSGSEDSSSQIVGKEEPSGGYVLTLPNALSIALRSQPQLGAAKAGVTSAKAGIGIAQSQYYPTLAGSSAYTRETGNFGPQPGFPFTIPESPVSYDFYQASLTLTQTLFAFGRRSSQVAQNRALYKASHQGAAKTVTDVIFGVEKAYFSVLKDQELLDVDRLTLADYRLQLRVAQARYNDGVANAYDVLNARVNLSNMVLTQVQDKNQFHVDELALNRAMGVIGHSPYRVAPYHPELSIPYTPEQVVAIAISHRPDLKQLDQQTIAQKQAVRFNQAQFMPTVQTVGAYSLDSEFFPLVYNWSVATTVTIPIFNGFLNVQQVRQSRAQLKQVRFQREDLRQGVIQSVLSDLFTLKTAEQKIRDAQTLVEQAMQNLDLTETQFRVGTGTTVAVTQTERDLAKARSDLVQAQADFAISLAQLKRDMGINYDFDHNSLPTGGLP